MPKKLQHTLVLARHHRVKEPNLFVSRFVGQSAGPKKLLSDREVIGHMDQYHCNTL